ncbi:hypothetical protein GRX03_10565 [Halovenus sp. WSH3]|uniref:Uncharacterized protein n=1 Tax=Halovenus carboxidivorans TaxID=2692199 RepID=A0A6B0TFS9_9EURY|nr:hypothetical protein [Halovenus carboxidivorans]MXR52039.1 hypothetical protein [Halovenus carboxidivorans]
MTKMPMWPYSKRSQENTDEDLPLREFVYLDETSVVSLLASLTREVTQARTETDTTEEQEGWGAKIKATLPLIGSGVDAHHLEIDRDTEEVVRRSEIQSKFDELYSETSSQFELQNGEQDVTRDLSDVSEGGVAEVEVEFSAHELFHYYKAFEYLIDMAEGAEYEFNDDEKQIVELLGSLFGEQIPVVGEVHGYRLVEGKLRPTETVSEDESEPLLIVGTLDPDMMWQEASQFLFEDNQYTAYVRIPEPEIQDEWDPLKLTRVIRSISPRIGDQLSVVLDGALRQAKQEIDETSIENVAVQDDLVNDRHHNYFDYIEEEHEITVSDEYRAQIVEDAYESNNSPEDASDYEIESEVLKDATDSIEEDKDVELDRESLSDFRSDILDQQQNGPVPGSSEEDQNYLEVSFVAIYW